MVSMFNGQYSFLSNFYLCKIEYHGKVYKSAEHLYQAFKAVKGFDRKRVRDASSASAAKRIGQEIAMRKDWENVKDFIMTLVVLQKFKQNKELREKLLKTSPQRLVEGNRWHDKYWGRCFCKNCDGAGENKLGKTLEVVRRFLK